MSEPIPSNVMTIPDMLEQLLEELAVQDGKLEKILGQLDDIGIKIEDLTDQLAEAVFQREYPLERDE